MTADDDTSQLKTAGDAAAPHAPSAAPAAAASAAGYRVLARKYRPANFDDLIGHGPMVQTLSNAFATGRIAQAWMLTGVRGVGKTTTARILARALNYDVDGGPSGPSVAMPAIGRHCQAIMEGRHVDVIEIDAASHTGVSDIREITDAARYKPVSARYKVYIVDEVHMLSTAAFNALLKTLEEPPEHVKFVFATTEIRKVPITVLSRCQRFDLRRVDAGLLVGHLARIAEAEGVAVDAEALALIARAAEGSVRDSLTILDQAIAHGGGRVEGAAVRAMLGLADRGRVIDLFEMVMKGDIAAALGELSDQYDTGADPAVVLADLAAFTHLVTRTKLVPASADDPSLTEAERERGRSFAAALSVRVLSRAWQMLLKGIAEVQAAPRPLPAAEMVLVRIAYAADLPTPDEALKALADLRGGAPARGAPGGGSAGGPVGGSVGGSGGGAPSPTLSAAGPAPRAPALRPLPTPVGATARLAPGAQERAAERPVEQPAEGPRLESFDDVVALAAARRDIGLKVALERHVRLVRFEPGRIEINPGPGAGPNLAGELGRKLTDWTGRRWIVAVSREEGGATVQERRESEKRSMEDEARADPLVSAILSSFPGAKIVDIRSVLDEPAAAGEAGEAPPDYGDDAFDPDAYDLDAMFRDLDDD